MRRYHFTIIFIIRFCDFNEILSFFKSKYKNGCDDFVILVRFVGVRGGGGIINPETLRYVINGLLCKLFY